MNAQQHLCSPEGCDSATHNGRTLEEDRAIQEDGIDEMAPGILLEELLGTSALFRHLPNGGPYM